MATDVQELLEEMRNNPKNIRSVDACKVAEHFFGTPRKRGSHVMWKMPWAGNPRVNLQDKGGKAKAYQVKQLLEAIDRQEEER